MTEVNFELTSICPLKMDRWTDGQQPKNDEGYRKQAPLKAYRDSKGNLAIPAAAVKAVMRYASSEVGKKMEGKKNRQTIQSAIFIEPENLTLYGSNNKPMKDFDEIVRDIVVRKLGKQDTRIPTYRPLIKKWTLKGTINLFSTPEEFARECLELGGMRYGLLSHRPDFGRFKVTSWKIKK